MEGEKKHTETNATLSFALNTEKWFGNLVGVLFGKSVLCLQNKLINKKKLLALRSCL